MSNSQRVHFLSATTTIAVPAATSVTTQQQQQQQQQQKHEIKSMSLDKDSRQRSNSQRPNENELNADNQPLFHTFCVGQSNRQMLVGPQNANWFVFEEFVYDMFKNNGQLERGKLKKIQEIVHSLMSSTMAVYVYDRFKGQLLPNAVSTLQDNIDENNLLSSLATVWDIFFKRILTTLESMLCGVKINHNLSIRSLALVSFRDQILLNTPRLEEQLEGVRKQGATLNPTIVHMVLIVQSIFETFPPSRNKLRMEKLAALVVSPYLGYRGLYLNYNNETPAVKSDEPLLIAKMKNNPQMSIISGKLSPPINPPPRLVIIPSPSISINRPRSPNRLKAVFGGEPVSPKRRNINYLMAKIHRPF